MSSSNRSSRTPRHRPATIEELANQAKADLDDPRTQGLKNWLRVAEKARKSGQIYKDRGDIESAFVEFARAATIVLDHLPQHPEYTTLLNGEQRRNLGNVRASPFMLFLVLVFFCNIACPCSLDPLTGGIYRTDRIYLHNLVNAKSIWYNDMKTGSRELAVVVRPPLNSLLTQEKTRFVERRNRKDGHSKKNGSSKLLKQLVKSKNGNEVL